MRLGDFGISKTLNSSMSFASTFVVSNRSESNSNRPARFELGRGRGAHWPPPPPLESRVRSPHAWQGTPLYLSPELCEGKEYDSSSDIWSLGAVAHELASLQPPFRAQTMPALLLQIINDDACAQGAPNRRGRCSAVAPHGGRSAA